MNDDVVARTQATYRQIAADYARERQHRDVMIPFTIQFMQLLPAGGRVVDVGCGPGFETAVFRDHNLQTIAVDYSPAMMLAGRSELGLNLDFVQADMRQLPLGRRAADGVWCSAALLHLPRVDVPAALHGFLRVLRPGGFLFLSVKMGSGEQWSSRSYGQAAPRFFTFWQPEDLDALLTASGFDVVDGAQNEGNGVSWLSRFARRRA